MNPLERLDRGEIANLDDLLTPEEQERLNADLAEMARLRRRAYDAARDWPLP